jgi:hypothetical protein
MYQLLRSRHFRRLRKTAKIDVTNMMFVDPTIGSGGIGYGAGGINPGAQVPFGSLRIGPDTALGDRDIVLLRFVVGQTDPRGDFVAYENTGDGTFTERKGVLPRRRKYDRAMPMTLADFDGDGRIEACGGRHIARSSCGGAVAGGSTLEGSATPSSMSRASACVRGGAAGVRAHRICVMPWW